MARCEMVADMRRGGGWRVVGVGGGGVTTSVSVLVLDNNYTEMRQ